MIRRVLLLIRDLAMSIDSSHLGKLKLILLGEASVGKSSLVSRFTLSTFPDYMATIGVDFTGKTLFIHDRPVRLQLWDTAGQERFFSLAASYVRASRVAILVYDVTDKESLVEAERWLDVVRRERGEEVTVLLLGNKIDLVEDRQVSAEEGRAWAEERGLLHFEASAKTGEGVERAFVRVVEKALEERPADAAFPVVEDEGDRTIYLSPTSTRLHEDEGCSC